MTPNDAPKGVELLALVGTLSAMPSHHQKTIRDYARANVEASVAELRAEHAELRDEFYRVVRALSDEQARAERLAEALRFYANPEVYKPHPHGPAFDRRDLSFVAINALTTPAQPGETE